MGAGRGGGNQGCNKDSTKEEPAEISGSLNHEPPESQPDSGEQPRGSTCADCSGFGVMGQQESIMGETHNGRRFTEVYEEHQSYVDWVSARAKNATPAMQDFITYCQARSDMEKQALRGR